MPLVGHDIEAELGALCLEVIVAAREVLPHDVRLVVLGGGLRGSVVVLRFWRGDLVVGLLSLEASELREAGFAVLRRGAEVAE